jgi:hypothetical protein
MRAALTMPLALPACADRAFPASGAVWALSLPGSTRPRSCHTLLCRDLVRTRVESGFEVEEMLEGAKDAFWIGNESHHAACCPCSILRVFQHGLLLWGTPKPATPL